MSDDALDYNVPNIRQLLIKAFTDTEELRRFCRDQKTFRPILSKVNEGEGMLAHADAIIALCDTRLVFEELLTALQKENPEQYQNCRPYRTHEPELHGTATAPLADDPQRQQAPHQQPGSEELPQRVKPVLTKVLVAISLVVIAFIAGYFYSQWRASSAEPPSDTVDGRLEIDAIPFTLDHWVWAELESETGWVYMSLINGPDNTRSYKLDFTLPSTATKYSGAGIVFKFPESDPIDLTEYEFVELDITFGCPEVRCQLEMNDISGAEASVLLGMGMQYAQGIDAYSTGDTQTIRIPLEQYFGIINLKVIQEMGCTVNTGLIQDYHHFQINQIAFVKE
jgi:hypothetical protein